MFLKTKITCMISRALVLSCLGLFVFTPAFAQNPESLDVTTGNVDGLVIPDTYEILNVSDAGIATNTAINSGGTVNVSNGGKADSTTVNAYGNFIVANGGSATNTIVKENGNLDISGGSVDRAVIEMGGMVNAQTSGTNLNDLTVNDGARFNFSTDITLSDARFGDGSDIGTISDGKAHNLVINEGSNLNVNSGDKAEETVVKAGGTLTANEAGAIVTNAYIENGGKFDFSTDADVSGLIINGEASSATITEKKASGFVLREGQTLTAADGGNITSSGVLGGTAIIASGGTITDTTIGNGGTLVAKEEGAIVGENVFIGEDGKFDISTNATIENLDVNGNLINVSSKKVSNAVLTAGGKLTVEEFGFADNIAVEGGNLVVNDGGTAQNTSVNGGELIVNGGQVETLRISDSGVVNASGGIILAGGASDGSYIPEVSVADGGIINLSGTAIAKDVFVNSGGTLNINDGGTAQNTSVDGGEVNVNQNGILNEATASSGGRVNGSANSQILSLTLNNGGTLATSGNAQVSNLVANDGSTLNLAADTVLANRLSISAGANALGSALNFENLFTSGTLLESLVVDGGVNKAFNGNLTNQTTDDKKLTLQNGSYTISNSGQNGAVIISGWNSVDVSASTVRLEADVTMSGTEKNFNVLGSSTLDVSGTLENVLNVTLNGNLVNSGKIDFTTQGDSAQDTLTINGDYYGNEGAIINLNINPQEGTSDKLVVNGNVGGTTSVYMKSVNGYLPANNLVFAEATGMAEANAFSIWRVEGSPFNWDVLFENNKWYGYVTDGDRPTLVPETVAYYGLIDNTFMQTASLGASLRNNIALSEMRKVPCKVPNNLKYTNRICRGNRPVFTGWAAPVYSTATVEAPYNYEASVSGLDGGLDLISDGYAKFGLLASYRQGVYQFEESGENYTLKEEAAAETKINSYLGGAYVRFDGTSWSVLAAAYGGILDADISTSDGVVSSSSGTTFGATLDVTYIWQNINGFRIQPGVRIGYTSVKMDEIEDNVGKKQEFDNASRIEAEAGIRLAKVWDFNTARAEIFVKPAVVQTTNNSGTFELIEGRELDNTEDRTMAKMEAGMSFNMTGNWSASLAGSYSFGSDYASASAGLSLIYNF